MTATPYQILERVATTAGSHLHRGRRVDGAPVMLKLLAPEDIPGHGDRFRREYAILRGLDSPGVVKPVALIDEPGKLMMVLDSFEGELVEDVLARRKKIGLPGCLRLALQLTQIVGALHAARLVHRDFRPANLMLLADDELLLLDASLASDDAMPTVAPESAPVGDWAYISPEQTGRINRAVDYRTDFYSLGVVLYRMLTGQLPCHGDDALEWAHCHLASVPEAPSDLDPSIPPVLSAIVLKLLEKMPEQRYQSSHGLRSDLEQCQRLWQADGTIAAFALGAQDVNEHLQLPRTLIDREAERAQLLASHDAMMAAGRPVLALVSGSAGLGKTRLVEALRQPILERHGLFITGTFDQYQREIPYGTVSQALQTLVEQILAGSESEVARWRGQIQAALGANGQLIIDVLPQVELIIGPQRPLPQVSPAEAQNRFRIVFLNFIGVFARQAHPLTMFLDNVHWADAASLRLLKDLARAPAGFYLQIIGAYRDDELDRGHPLALMVEELGKQGVALTRIALGPLSKTALGAFVDAMLNAEPGTAASLADLIYEKTAGNPLFVGQFVASLADEGLIAFDARAGVWRWQLDQIRAKQHTDNVAGLMIEKLGRLPEAARALLQLLACLGSEVPEADLLGLSTQSEAHGQDALAAAVRAGLIVRDHGKVKFLHDRVQEAAYLSLPPPARAALHACIGRQLMRGKPQARIDESIFAIVNQLNRGASAIVDPDEKATLQHLNFLAGMKAKAAVDLDSARRFLARALAALPPDAWERQYRDTLELYLALSECENLAGKFPRADELADQVLAHARSKHDSARVHMLRIALNQMAGRLDDAVASMVTGVQLFGMDFPSDKAGLEAAIGAEMDEIAASVHGRRIADLPAMQPPADPDTATVLALLAEGIAPSYMVQPDYFSLIVARATRLSLQRGHTEDSAFAYSAYGCLLVSRGDIASALEFSRMAMRLNDQLGGRRRTGRVIATHAIAYGCFSHAMAEIRPMLERAWAACLDVGDLVYGSYITMTYFWAELQAGRQLDEVDRMMRAPCELARESHHDPVYQTLRFQRQLVASLKGRTRAAASMDDQDFDEAACLAALEQADFGVGLQGSHMAKQVSAFIYGHFDAALEAAHQAALHVHAAVSMMIFDAAYHFFLGLTVAALHPRASGERQRELADRLAKELERHKRWSDASPRNFLSRYALLGAETARIQARHDDAQRLYEQAIGSARENGFVHILAMACELASGFYRERGLALVADTYLRESHAAYLRWGAEGKARQLSEAHPQLFAQAAPASAALERERARLDLLSIAKASQAISSQLVLGELVDTLMRIVLENAGAQTGYLLLVRDRDLMFVADAHVGQTGVCVNVHVDRLLPAGLLPESIVNYVRRSRELVLLPDLDQANAFARDPYFSDQAQKSILCLPVVQQDALIGMLYLESGLITRAFATDHLAVLQLLASQAAISLQNATLYAGLQKREAKIRRLFESNIVGIVFYGLDGRIMGANDAALAILGYSREDLETGKIRWPDLTPPEWRPGEERAIAELKRTGVCRPFEREFLRKDGSRVPVLVAAAMFEDGSDEGVSFLLDLTERKRAEEQMRYMAHHDALTGLPNRTLLQDRLEQAISQAHRGRHRAALLFIDLDYFKYINDSLGHQLGDTVLRMTAARLQKCVREGDSVARLGGDEFVICLPALGGGHEAANVARKALDALAESFVIDDHELHISASIGISLYPDDAADVPALMRTADTAMYHAKEKGRGNFQFFTERLNLAAQQRLEVGKRLRHALFHDEFILHYQPQVEMESGTIFAAEALLRWQREGHAPISCADFIASAEESGLIVPIGELTLRQACRQLRIWRDRGHPELKIAVNLSPRQLDTASFCTTVGQILDEARLPPGALELEITEGIFLQHSDTTVASLSKLRDMGVKLSVDDFGTGYSSLAYLQRFPVHALKIDQSFVRAIGTNRNHRALITAIIAMAQSLELKIMAEGVETQEQINFLMAHGCHCAQGFYYSKPVPAQRFSDMLDISHPAR
jgi:diguanylate cyclase (GGDEF)-like protein/PAS domain S-box-containing protein